MTVQLSQLIRYLVEVQEIDIHNEDASAAGNLATEALMAQPGREGWD